MSVGMRRDQKSEVHRFHHRFHQKSASDVIASDGFASETTVGENGIYLSKDWVVHCAKVLQPWPFALYISQ